MDLNEFLKKEVIGDDNFNYFQIKPHPSDVKVQNSHW